MQGKQIMPGEMSSAHATHGNSLLRHCHKSVTCVFWTGRGPDHSTTGRTQSRNRGGLTGTRRMWLPAGLFPNSLMLVVRLGDMSYFDLNPCATLFNCPLFVQPGYRKDGMRITVSWKGTVNIAAQAQEWNNKVFFRAN